MPPQAVPGLGLEGHVVVVGVGVCALVVQRQVDVAVPGEVLDQWLGLNHLLDARQLDGLRRLGGPQHHLAVVALVQGVGQLRVLEVVLADQHRGLALQRGDLLPIQRDGTAIVRVQHQLAAIQHLDLAGQAIAVLQPYGVGERRGGDTAQGQAQQVSQQHRRRSASRVRVSPGIIRTHGN